QCDPVGNFCDPDVAQPFTLRTSVAAGALEILRLDAEVNGGGEPGGSNTDATAAVDPTIIIDPDFPFKDDYHLVFSPNLLVPASPAPETPGWLLMLTGAGVVGLRGCRGRYVAGRLLVAMGLAGVGLRVRRGQG